MAKQVMIKMIVPDRTCMRKALTIARKQPPTAIGENQAINCTESMPITFRMLYEVRHRPTGSWN